MNCRNHHGNCNQGRDCPCVKDVYKDDVDSFITELIVFVWMAVVVLIGLAFVTFF
jgi:hypothetical protein